MKNVKAICYLHQVVKYRLLFGNMKKNMEISYSVPLLLIDFDGADMNGKNSSIVSEPAEGMLSLANFHLIPANASIQITTKNKNLALIILNVISDDFNRFKELMLCEKSASYEPNKSRASGSLIFQQERLKIYIANKEESEARLRKFVSLLLNRLIAPQQDQRVVQVSEILHEKIGTNILIDDLAASVCLSVPRLVQLFKQRTGLTIRRFRLLIRVEFVIEQVCSGASPTYASAEAGFSDYSHFSRSFKEMFGLNPREMFRDIQVTTFQCGQPH